MRKKMNTCISTIFAVLVLSLAAFGQGENSNPLPKQTNPASSVTCALTLKEAPVFHNLRLGMGKAEFETLFKGVSKINGSAVNEFLYQAELAGADLRKAKNFEQIEMIRGWFFEDKLYRLSVIYDKTTFKWKTSSEFAENLSTSHKLPANAWGSMAMLGQVFLRCKEFNIMVNNNALVIGDSIASLKLRNAMQKKEEENNKSAKP
jgi:hypothetical protein